MTTETDHDGVRKHSRFKTFLYLCCWFSPFTVGLFLGLLPFPWVLVVTAVTVVAALYYIKNEDKYLGGYGFAELVYYLTPTFIFGMWLVAVIRWIFS